MAHVHAAYKLSRLTHSTRACGIQIVIKANIARVGGVGTCAKDKHSHVHVFQDRHEPIGTSPWAKRLSFLCVRHANHATTKNVL